MPLGNVRPDRGGDPDAAPVEVAVVAELCTSRRKQVKQPPPGGGRLAADCAIFARFYRARFASWEGIRLGGAR